MSKYGVVTANTHQGLGTGRHDQAVLALSRHFVSLCCPNYYAIFVCVCVFLPRSHLLNLAPVFYYYYLGGRSDRQCRAFLSERGRDFFLACASYSSYFLFLNLVHFRPSYSIPPTLFFLLSLHDKPLLPLTNPSLPTARW